MEIEDAHTGKNISSRDSQTISVDAGAPRFSKNNHGADPEAQEMVIESLREQIQELFSQVGQLNNKLVKSYDRVSDLEDEIHISSANIRSSSIKISQLELERSQHLSALNTGLLVERSHVTAELSRLMERATEEAAQRGQAESARIAIEKELDDLSSALFIQANGMVAEANYARYISERKVEEAEQALSGAEEAVSLMQQQLQVLQAEKEKAELKAQEVHVIMTSGKWEDKRQSGALALPFRLLNGHAPFQEFLMFVAHLRSIHTSAAGPPSLSNLLQLPFLARLSTEDSEPVLRLDLAPSLNWLSRRSVLSAIYTGQLSIEPISIASLIRESSHSTSTSVAGLGSSGLENVSCALCGAFVCNAFEPGSGSFKTSRPLYPINMTGSYSNSWSASIFKKSTFGSRGGNDSQPSTRPQSPSQISISRSVPNAHSTQIYIFKVSSSSTSPMSTYPLSSITKTANSQASSASTYIPASRNISPSNASNHATSIYPLCLNGWCLARLRATCNVWAYVRAGVVDRVWDEEIPNVSQTIAPTLSNGDKSSLPIKKRGLWGLASALGGKSISSRSDPEKERSSYGIKPSLDNQDESHTKTQVNRRLPPPPPVHPTRGLLNDQDLGSLATPHSPPPLPQRSRGRNMPPPPSLPTSPVVTGDVTSPEQAIVSHVLPPPVPPRARGHVVPPHPDDTISTTANISDSGGTTKEKDLITAPLAPAALILDETESLVSPPPLRVGTPSNIPLPESLPSTPVMQGISPVSPGLTGTPPPLPRRAAARIARPISMLIDGSSRPVTPASPFPRETTQALPVVADDAATVTKGEVVDTVVSGAQAVVENSVEGKALPLEQVQESNVRPLEATEEGLSGTNVERLLEEEENHVSASEASVHSLKGSPLSSEDVFVDAPIDTDGVAETSAFVDSADPTEVKGDTETIHADEENDVNGACVGADERGFEGADAGKSKAIEHPKLAIQLEEKESERQGNEDNEMYVGDATWEDRAWRELVRLREDMFWARIGRLR